MSDNRRATRLACRLPVRLSAQKNPLEATVLDVSRGGARLRVAGNQLGLYRLAPLSQVARRVTEVLGESFEATLMPERLGTLVRKTLRAVRIGQREAHAADVELGCLLTPPLTDLEASMLGLALPCLDPQGREKAERLETTEVVVRVALPKSIPAPAPTAAVHAATTPPPRVLAILPRAGAADARGKSPATKADLPAPTAPAADRPVAPAPALDVPEEDGRARLGWRAVVHPSGDRRVPPFQAAAESVTSEGVQLRVADRRELRMQAAPDVASTIQGLDAAYGTDVALKLVDGPTHLWTGPARIEEVEVPASAPHEIALWLRFGRALRVPELRALGLS